MKGLKYYIDFLWDLFARGKKFMVVNCTDWNDYQTKQHLGSKVEVVIVEDKTPYTSTNGEAVTNLYEKLTFKVSKEIKIPQNALVEPVNVTAKVYGEYRNQLSIKCDDIKILSQGQKPNAIQ